PRPFFFGPGADCWYVEPQPPWPAPPSWGEPPPGGGGGQEGSGADEEPEAGPGVPWPAGPPGAPVSSDALCMPDAPWSPWAPGVRGDSGGTGGRGVVGSVPLSGAGCSWCAGAAGASTGVGGADGAGGTAVPSFSVLTALLLDPRLVQVIRTRSRSFTSAHAVDELRARWGCAGLGLFVRRQHFPHAVRAP